MSFNREDYILKYASIDNPKGGKSGWTTAELRKGIRRYNTYVKDKDEVYTWQLSNIGPKGIEKKYRKKAWKMLPGMNDDAYGYTGIVTDEAERKAIKAKHSWWNA